LNEKFPLSFVLGGKGKLRFISRQQTGVFTRLGCCLATCFFTITFSLFRPPIQLLGMLPDTITCFIWTRGA